MDCARKLETAVRIEAWIVAVIRGESMVKMKVFGDVAVRKVGTLW